MYFLTNPRTSLRAWMLPLIIGSCRGPKLRQLSAEASQPRETTGNGSKASRVAHHVIRGFWSLRFSFQSHSVLLRTTPLLCESTYSNYIQILTTFSSRPY